MEIAVEMSNFYEFFQVFIEKLNHWKTESFAKQSEIKGWKSLCKSWVLIVFIKTPDSRLLSVWVSGEFWVVDGVQSPFCTGGIGDYTRGSAEETQAQCFFPVFHLFRWLKKSGPFKD